MRLPLVLAVAATVAAWLPPVIFGGRWRDYSAARDFISELGAAGAPDAGLVNASFALAGVLFVATCLAVGRVRPEWRSGVALISAAGWSYLVAAVVPCDAGCPAQGSGLQAVHNTAGAAGYFLAGIGSLVLAGPVSRAGWPGLALLTRTAGLVAIGGLAAMGAPELDEVRGSIQRLVELGLFAAVVTVARASVVAPGSQRAAGPARP